MWIIELFYILVIKEFIPEVQVIFIWSDNIGIRSLITTLNPVISIVKKYRILNNDLWMAIFAYRSCHKLHDLEVNGSAWTVPGSSGQRFILSVLLKRLKLKSAVDIYISALSNLKASGLFHDISIDRLFGNIPQLYQENIWKLAPFDLVRPCMTSEHS